MKILDLIQGSPAWLAHRAQHFNASDAPAMMGCSIYKTRAELLRELHTGIAPHVDAATQKRFDAGHRLEALARPLAEEFIGAELYPVTGTEGRFSASLDGLTMDGSINFEHKHLNANLRSCMTQQDGNGNELLPEMYCVQMEQQLLVCGADRTMFMASMWNDEDDLVEERHCWYTPDLELRARIVAGWDRFEQDLAVYELPAAVAAAPVGKAPETLPALRIEVTGAVTASNLAEFKQSALAAIRSVNRELTTDVHFADAEKAVKWCDEVEKRLAAAKQHALSQTASIDALFNAIDDISAEARMVRLGLNKLVTERKTQVKIEMVSAALRLYEQHEDALRKDTDGVWIVLMRPDFAGAIKSLRSVDSVQNAIDTTLAAAKIWADESAHKIRESLRILAGAGFNFLFSDRLALIAKAPDDLRLLVKSRIDAHEASEAEKACKAVEAVAERADLDAKQAAFEATKAAFEAIPVVRVETVAAPAVVQLRAAPPVVAPRADQPATLRLGDICSRFGFVMTAAFVADTLGVKPAKVEGASKLYREGDFDCICAALQKHIAGVSEAVAA